MPEARFTLTVTDLPKFKEVIERILTLRESCEEMWPWQIKEEIDDILSDFMGEPDA